MEGLTIPIKSATTSSMALALPDYAEGATDSDRTTARSPKACLRAEATALVGSDSVLKAAAVPKNVAVRLAPGRIMSSVRQHDDLL